MKSALAESIDSNESSLGFQSSENIPRDEYVSKRQLSISHLRTRHTLSQLRIDFPQVSHPNLANVDCDFAILRFLQFHRDEVHRDEESGRFHSFGQYGITVERSYTRGLPDNLPGVSEVWLIRSIRETGLRNEGNPKIYGATQGSPL